jgi:DNA-binding NarL/FixJ family response regulator
MSHPVRVLVADDHPLTRVGIRHALADSAFALCAEANDADEAVAAAIRERPDICLLDVMMPGNGIRAAERILNAVPEAVVVMVTAADDDGSLIAAVRAGARGFLPKGAALNRLPQILQGVLDGEAALPRELTARVLAELRTPGAVRVQRRGLRRPRHSLTSREADVLELLLQGLETGEIAGRLYLSAATIRSHVAALMRKFEVRDRAALRALFPAP